MSTPIFPQAVWQSGTNENSIPANDNSLRNEAINRNVISRVVTAQPVSPGDGDVYILASTHTGAQWSSFIADDIVIYRGGTWYAFTPVDGVVVNSNSTLYEYTGPSAGWVAISGGGGSVSSVNGDTGAVLVLQPIIAACSDETTALVTGAAKVTFRLPYAFTLTAIPRASLSTAQTSGSLITVDINRNGSTIFATRITIDNTEKTSTTAVTAAVLTTAPGFPTWSNDDEITVDLDQIGDGTAKGLKITLIGYAS